MAKVTGPLFSMTASGSVGDVVTYGSWKGINWCRTWFIPANPQTAKQVNMRTALTLMVAKWQTLSEGSQGVWNTFAEGTKMSGYNQFLKRGLKEYIVQLTVDVTPTTISIAGNPPDEIWTWGSA